ncbi:IKI3-like protein [Encephalitozoon cuniculi]|nr:IKI3-like protein [Encephalitozoon cuniculi]
MENFFFRYMSTVEIGKGDWIYSKGYVAKESSIYDESGTKRFEIPFVPKHFHVLTFEYFLIDELDTIHLVNRSTLEMVEVGKVSDGVVLASISADEKWCVVISTREILLFDTYIDLKKSAKVEFGRAIRVEWADYGLFAVLTNKKILFYDTELNLVGRSEEREYTSLSWRSKYNIFGCSTSESVRFIEPNGLEHGDPLNVGCSELAFLENEDLLITVQHNAEGSLLKVFYTKNFRWYLKVSRQIPGKFLCTEKNTVLFRDGERIIRVFLSEEKTRHGSEYYVIDGSYMLYTDFSEKILPPPLFSVRVGFDTNIVDVFPAEKKGVILLRDRAIMFRWDGEDFINERTFLLEDEFDSIVLFDGFLVLKSGHEFLVKEVNGEEDTYITRNGDVDERKKRGTVGTRRTSTVVHQLCQTLKRYGCVGVVKHYNFEEKLYLLLGNGVIVYGSDPVHSGIDIAQRLEVCVKKSIFVHNGTKLFVDGDTTENITSFLVGEHGMITISEGTCRFFFESKQSVCQVDHKLELLCMVDFRVIGVTRHGTLETYTPKIYTLAFVKKLLADKKYKDAIDGCQRYIVPFGVFLDHDIELEKFVTECRDAHLVSFFSEALQRLGDFDFILESERARRFRKVFDLTAVLEPKDTREHFEELIGNDESIDTNSLAHLTGWGNGKGLFMRRKPYSRCLKSLPEDVKNLCGRRARDFFNEFLLSLDLKSNFKFIISLLVKVKRIDLALQVARHDLKAGVEHMLSVTNTSSIMNSALGTCNEDLIREVMKICRKDSSDFLSLVRRYRGSLQKFKINDFLGNRVDALYHISRTKMTDVEKKYIEKHGLIDEALMYEACGLSTREKGYYFNLCAELLPSDKALVLFRKAGNTEKALETAVENLYWREAMDLHGSEGREEFCELMVSRLVESEKHYEAGQLLEEFLGKSERAFAEYVKAKSMGDALRVCSDAECLMQEAREILREKLLTLNDVKESFVKYRNRLEALEEREDECMSETSFSYTENMGGGRSTRIKNRPGGRYEREFVLSRIRDIALSLVGWRNETEDLVRIFKEFGMEECTRAHNTSFDEVGRAIKTEIDSIFEVERRLLYDPNRPVVEKPDLSKWL